MDFSSDILDSLIQAFNLRLGFGLLCGIIGFLLFLTCTTICLVSRRQSYGSHQSNRRMDGLLSEFEGRLSIELNLLSG